MKKLFSLILCCLLTTFLISCNTAETEKPTVTSFPERAKDMNIYEANIRQYTPEGTFQAFLPHMDRLKEMGVDILWFMPIQPIGKEKRKGELGSYYSIMDYTAVNPDYGTLEDFKAVVNKAHELEMPVILDWVANHTAWDHIWTEQHPEFYSRDSLGNMMAPVPDWTDVADLNYNVPELHNEMIKEMQFWLKEVNIDGFRCDVAGMVPNDFWQKAIDSLQATKDVFMLAEWDEPEMHEAGFHMTYGWSFHHLLNDLAQGKANADSLQSFLEKDNERYDSADFRMFFTSNHDENSWNGTVFERMGDAYEALAVLTSTVKGMPLIYSGQEAGLDERLSFFDKDTINWSTLNYQNFYKKLLKLKHENQALWNGNFGGRALRVNSAYNTENIYAFSRRKSTGGLAFNEVLVVLNLSDTEQSFIIDAPYRGIKYENTETGDPMIFSEEKLPLAAWSYLILTRNSIP